MASPLQPQLILIANGSRAASCDIHLYLAALGCCSDADQGILHVHSSQRIVMGTADVSKELPERCDARDAECIATYLSCAPGSLMSPNAPTHPKRRMMPDESDDSINDRMFAACNWSVPRCASLYHGALSLGLHDLADMVEEIVQELLLSRKITSEQVLQAFQGAAFVPAMLGRLLDHVHPAFPIERVLQALVKSPMLLLMRAQPSKIPFGDLPTVADAMILINNDLIEAACEAQGIAAPHVARLRKWRECFGPEREEDLRGTCTVYLKSNVATFTMNQPATWMTEHSASVPTMGAPGSSWLLRDADAACYDSEWQIPINEYDLFMREKSKHNLTLETLQRMIDAWAYEIFLVLPSDNPRRPVYCRRPEGPCAMKRMDYGEVMGAF